MTEYLFDSTVLIDHLRGRPVVAPYLNAVFDGTTKAWFSVVTEAELWAGIRSPDERTKYEALFALMKRINVTKDIARHAGSYFGKYRHQGLFLPDALIAASALISKKTLLTRNSKHFRWVQDDFKVEFYTL
ncbi:MAG: type II toxin-antitoxin system VapC family toxin [Chloroflexi bacterium]|nr:type II toxin-antitoxin system VapC family toxin [Chloroflexota bacterium]